MVKNISQQIRTGAISARAGAWVWHRYRSEGLSRQIRFFWAYASWTFAYSDPNFAKKVDETLVGFIVNNPRVMRTLPRLLTQAGLVLEEMTPHILAEVGKGSFFLGAAETYAPLIVKAGLLPEDQMHNWLKEQHQSNEEGTFFAAGNYYTYLARRI